MYEDLKQFKDQYLLKKDRDFKHSWNYVSYIVLKSYIDDYLITNNKIYFNEVKNFIDTLIYEENQDYFLKEVNFSYNSVDQIKMADALFFLYDETKDLKYKILLDKFFKQLKNYPRTKENSFWHKDNYPYQVWLDGLYMLQPFYAKYLTKFKNKKDYQDIILQFDNVRKYIYNPHNKLYAHAYDSSKDIFWADKITGQSKYPWSRALGWLMMAFVDVKEIINDENITLNLSKYLLELTDNLISYQDKDGMWFQIVDHPNYQDNYLETSGTLMISYAILKAIRLNYLDKKYQDIALKAFKGTINKYFRKENELYYLGGICQGAGLGMHPDLHYMRDGSYHYYTKEEKIIENNGHGVAPLFMVLNELTLYK